MPKTAQTLLDVDRFRADLSRLAPVAPGSTLGLAVSGGPDSSALAWLTQYAVPDVRLFVAVVDHGLRVDSAEEATRVTEWMRERGFEAETLTWTPPKPVNRAKMEQARLARFSLLRRWARRKGLLRIWLGHHADDQRETIQMRTAQGTGAEGARGMDPVRVDAEVVFERPLLHWPKQALIDLCEREGWAIVNDPTNTDLRTKRGAMRAQTSPSASAEDRAVETVPRPRTGSIVAHPLGHVWVQSNGLDAATLQALCGWVRGGHYAPSLKTVEHAVQTLKRASRTSLFGCIIEHRADHWILITREVRDKNELRAIQTVEGDWRLDDRWIVQDPNGSWGRLKRSDFPGEDELPERATAPVLTWNGVPGVFDGRSLIWPGNRATFAPFRPVFVHRAKEWRAP